MRIYNSGGWRVAAIGALLGVACTGLLLLGGGIAAAQYGAGGPLPAVPRIATPNQSSAPGGIADAVGGGAPVRVQRTQRPGAGNVLGTPLESESLGGAAGVNTNPSAQSVSLNELPRVQVISSDGLDATKLDREALPFTGARTSILILAGLALIAIGFWLRRRTHPASA